MGDNEQIRIGGLHFDAGGQFHALIGGLEGQREQKKRALNVFMRDLGELGKTGRTVTRLTEINVPLQILVLTFTK